jgi:hypothetical protein
MKISKKQREAKARGLIHIRVLIAQLGKKLLPDVRTDATPVSRP